MRSRRVIVCSTMLLPLQAFAAQQNAIRNDGR